MGEKSYVCGYKHCIHNGEKVTESEAIMVGKKKYHKDCLRVSEIIKLIRDTYIEHQNKDENYAVILRVVNTLVFNKGIDADYVLYWLEDINKKGIKLKSPYALHYCTKNLALKQKWREDLANRQ